MNLPSCVANIQIQYVVRDDLWNTLLASEPINFEVYEKCLSLCVGIANNKLFRFLT